MESCFNAVDKGFKLRGGYGVCMLVNPCYLLDKHRWERKSGDVSVSIFEGLVIIISSELLPRGDYITPPDGSKVLAQLLIGQFSLKASVLIIKLPLLKLPYLLFFPHSLQHCLTLHGGHVVAHELRQQTRSKSQHQSPHCFLKKCDGWRPEKKGTWYVVF
jgi:hypothetical protein